MQVSNNKYLNIKPELKKNFKAQVPCSNTFAAFNTFLPIPLNTSKAYCAPLIKPAVQTVSEIDVPYLGKGKIFVMPNGHKLAVIKSKSPFMITTSVKTSKESVNSAVSHITEHLLYKDSKQTSSGTFSQLKQKLGLDIGAQSEPYCTKYFMQYPFDDLGEIETVIKTQAELLQNPSNFEKDFDNEKKIITAEYILRNYSTGDKLPTIMANTLFNINLPVQEQQNFKELTQNIQLNELKAFYDKYYQNKNMATFIVGDVEPDILAMMFARYFNKPNNTTQENSQSQIKTVPITKTVRVDTQLNRKDANNILVGFVGAPNNDKQSNFMNVVIRAYLGNMNGEQDFDLQIKNTAEEGIDNSFIEFSTKAEEKDIECKLNDLYKKIEGLKQSTLSQDDLNKLKTYLKTSLTSVNASSYNVSVLGSENLLNSNDLDTFKYLSMVETLQTDDIKNYFNKYCDLSKAAVVIGHNKAENTEKLNNPSFKGSRTSFDTSGIVEYKYPNNHQLLVDSSSISPMTVYRLCLTTDKVPDLKTGIIEIFKNAFVNHLKNYENEYPHLTNVTFLISPEKFDVRAESTEENTLKSIDIIKYILLNMELTQKDLEEAKTIAKNMHSIESFKYNIDLNNSINNNDNLFNAIPLNITKQEAEKMIDDITLDDLKQYHQFILNNSQAKSVLVTSKENFEKNKTQIFAKINENMPVFQPKHKPDWQNKQISKIEKTRVLTEEIKNENASIQQDFKIPVNIDIKEKIITQLLKPIIEQDKEYGLIKTIRENKNLSYASGVIFDKPNNYYRRISLGCHIPLDKNNASDVKTVLDTLKNIIGKLTTRNISQEALGNAKTKFKSDILLNWKYSFFRNDILEEYGIENTRNLYKLLDSISTQDIRDFAKKYFTQPSIYSIVANKDVLNANQDLFKSIENKQNA